MSGVEIISSISTCVELLELVGRTAKYIIEFTEAARDYNNIAKELASKLGLLRTIFKLFERAAKRVRERQYIDSNDDLIDEAASIIQENIDACQSTLAVLLNKRPKALKGYDTGSFLRGAVRYLVYDIDGRPAIEAGLKEIDDRIKSMEIALHFIETDYVFNIRDAVDIGARGPDLAKQQDPRENDDDDNLLKPIIVKQSTTADIPQFSSTLKHSIDKTDVDTISKLLKLNHDPLAKDKDGWCALHYAARANNEQVCQILIISERIRTCPGSLETFNCTGATALHFAASIGSLRAVRVFLNAGANKDAIDHYKRSPLFMASEGGHLKVIELLLSLGARIPDNAPARLKELQCAINWRDRKAKKLKEKGRISDNAPPPGS